MPFRKRAGGRSGLQSIYLIVVGSAEVGGTDGAEIRIIFFRNIGAQEQSAVLSDAYERCPTVT